MIFVSFAWLGEHDTQESFEANTPFAFLGQQLQSMHFAGRFVILVLDGYDRLSPSYRVQLKTLGLELIDYGPDTRQLRSRFQGLDRFDRYGFFCFIRWIALRAFLTSENSREQIIHLDGDIVFNASPDEIAADLQGLTFVLQGCPAIATVSDYDWFAAYEEELLKFSRDISGYCNDAFHNKAGWLESARQKWAGVWDGPGMTHDQDLICYLIHADRLVQDRPGAFAKNLKLYYAQNPYWLHEGAELQLGRESGLSFSSRANACYLEDKKIALWHFQSFFARQLALVMELRRSGYVARYPDGSDPTVVGNLSGTIAMTRKELYLAIRELNPALSQADFSFADFYNRERFWKPGVFSNAERS